MYLKKGDIAHIRHLIAEINQSEDTAGVRLLLQEQVEDVEMFLEALGTVQKKKVEALRKKAKNPDKLKQKTRQDIRYSREDVEKIFREKKDAEILGMYSRNELAAMRVAIHGRCPTKERKEKIVSAIRGYFRAGDRAKAFQKD